MNVNNQNEESLLTVLKLTVAEMILLLKREDTLF